MKNPSLLSALAISTILMTAACSMHDDNQMAKPDSDMQAVLDAQASLHPKPIEKLSPGEARVQPSPADGAKLVMTQKGMNPNDPMGVVTKDIRYKGADGMLPARIYKPAGADKNLPVILYFHGGGWVIADLNTYDATPRAMAKQANAIVVSVEYRHAPEFKFPAAHEDAYAAYQWVLKNASGFGGDAKNVAIMGESAGGALALATSVKARDAGLRLPVRQVLVYPVGGVDMNTESYQENANAKPLNKPMMGWFMKHVVRNEADKQDPRLDAIGKADLHGLPPTTIVRAQIDPLRTDGELLADKLRSSGVDVHDKTYAGATHEFFGMGAVVGDAKDAEALVASDLKASFDR